MGFLISVCQSDTLSQGEQHCPAWPGTCVINNLCDTHVRVHVTFSLPSVLESLKVALVYPDLKHLRMSHALTYCVQKLLRTSYCLHDYHAPIQVDAQPICMPTNDTSCHHLLVL